MSFCTTIQRSASVSSYIAAVFSGLDGFGYMFIENKHYKIPQIGRVIIEDDVEIGSNVTIDRARTGSTRIGAGTKIDNQVHIGHNVSVGKNCVIVAQVGVGGSVSIGDGVILAGQVGIKDHVVIGDGTIVAAQAGVVGDLPKGSFVSGPFYRRVLIKMNSRTQVAIRSLCLKCKSW